MSKFTLQSNGERSIIAGELQPGFRPKSSVAAPDWLHAKRALGFELTPLQEELLDLDPPARLKVIQREKWVGMMDGFLAHRPQRRSW